jgi:heme/copper-type cytochrome/quinol oxidase subunit 3
MTTVLALPSGDRDRPKHLASITALLAGVAELMVVGGLVAAYLNVRGLAGRWPPKGASLDNYLGTTLFLTLVLSIITVEWGVYAVRRDNRRQALSSLALTIGLGLAFINLLWYVGTQLHFGPADHSYGVLVYALLIAPGVVAAIGIAFLLVAVARTVGGQVTPSNPELVRAAAWHWHVVSAAWLLAFMALYVLQHR